MSDSPDIANLPRRLLSDPAALVKFTAAAEAYAALGPLDNDRWAYLESLFNRLDLDSAECESVLDRLGLRTDEATSAAATTAEGDFVRSVLRRPVQVVAIVGESGIRVKDLLEMAIGSVLELDQHEGEPLALLVNRERIGHAEVVVRNDRFAVEVRDMVDWDDRLRAAIL